jgi:Arc/MetJ-type ribon-helix-helix transcriptional regulator
MDFPDDLEAWLNRLVEAGYFKSREEAVLKATEQLLKRLDPDGQPVANDRLDVETLFRRNQTYFEQHKEAFQKQYGHAFVAIWEERVVDHDADRARLAERVYKQFGAVPIYMDQPSVSPARFHVSSPVFAR